MKRALILLIAIASLNVNAMNIDRRPMALAAYRLFPNLVKIVESSIEFRTLTTQQQDVFIKVRKYTESRRIPLVFNPRPEDFDLREKEERRWMRTPINADGEVEINQSLLNSPDIEVTMPLLAKTIFHEWAHKIGENDWGLRDSVAQFFEDQVRRYTRIHNVDDTRKMKFTLVSVPYLAVPQVLEEVSSNRPQPTNALLVEVDGVVTDLTEPLLSSLEGPSGLLRSIFAEANRSIYEFLDRIVQELERSINPLFRAMVAANLGVKLEPNEKLERLRELTIFEMLDMDTIETADGVFARVKANYVVSRSLLKNLKIKFEDSIGLDNEYPAPINIAFRIPHGSDPAQLNAGSFSAALRPETDVMSSAKIASVQRNSEGNVQVLEVRLPQPTANHKIYLTVATEDGHRYLKSTSTETLPNGDLRVRFEIQWRQISPTRSLIAESVQIGTHKSLFLDRLIPLTAERALTGSDDRLPANEIVKNSLGFWGVIKSKPQFFTNFRFDQPIILMDNLNSDSAGFSFSNLLLEFELEHEEKIREIHFYYRRMAAMVNLNLTDKEIAKGEQPPKLLDVEWSGQTIKFATSGKMGRRRDFQEVATLDSTQVYRAETERGSQRVRAPFALPFVGIEDRPVTREEAYYPHMIYPVMVEIVLESGQVLRRSFGELSKSKCDDFVKEPLT